VDCLALGEPEEPADQGAEQSFGTVTWVRDASGLGRVEGGEVGGNGAGMPGLC